METEKHPHTAVILGGDQRMRYTAELLIEAGCPTTLYGQEQATPPPQFPAQQITAADLLILALPLTRDGVTLNAPFAPAPIPLRELLPHLHKGQTVVGGPFPEALAEAVRQAGATVYDPLGDEVFAQANALATAEGAIALALSTSTSCRSAASSAGRAISLRRCAAQATASACRHLPRGREI